jgi:hypothetical protein
MGAPITGPLSCILYASLTATVSTPRQTVVLRRRILRPEGAVWINHTLAGVACLPRRCLSFVCSNVSDLPTSSERFPHYPPAANTPHSRLPIPPATGKRPFQRQAKKTSSITSSHTCQACLENNCFNLIFTSSSRILVCACTQRLNCSVQLPVDAGRDSPPAIAK